MFEPNDELAPAERAELGYVDHEPSEAKRELRDTGPLVELMVTTEASGNEDDPKAEQTSRELDAEQLALRIVSLVNTGSAFAGSADILPASGNSSHVIPLNRTIRATWHSTKAGRMPALPANTLPANTLPALGTATSRCCFAR